MAKSPMPTPLDNILRELTELTAGLYEFLLRKETSPEGPGFREQLEQYARKTLVIRLFAGQCDCIGLHDACMQQQNYLRALITRGSAPAAHEWDRLERWPSLLLPCLMAPVSEAAVAELMTYFRNNTYAIPFSKHVEHTLRTNLLIPEHARQNRNENNIVTLPVMQELSAGHHQQANTAAEMTVRYVLQHELLDTVTEYLGVAELSTTPAAEHAQALRLCADRIQMLGISAAGSDLIGLMDCCLLCHDTLLKHLDVQGHLSAVRREQLKTWADLITHYLDTPESAEVVDVLLSFYQRGHFVPAMPQSEYDTLRELLLLDTAGQIPPRIEIKAVTQHPATAQIVTIPSFHDPQVEMDGGEESEPADALQAKSSVALLRVPANVIDDLVRLAGESLVLTSQLQERLRLCLQEPNAGKNSRQLEDHLAVFGELIPALARVNKDTREVVLRTRMLPVSDIVDRLQRSVQETCRATGKQANLTISGADTPLDGEMLDNLVDPLIHLLHHTIKHGLVASEIGEIVLRFARDGDHLVVRCCYEGNELDYGREWLAPIKGSLVFIAQGGREWIVEVRVPLSRISAPAIMVQSTTQVLAITSRCVEQILYAGPGQVQTEGGRLHYRVGEETYQAYALEQLLHLPIDHGWLEGAERTVLLVRHSTGRLCAVLVEQVLANEEVIVKHLGPYLPNILGIEGATILGNGSVAAVVDLRGLLQTAQPVKAEYEKLPR